MTETDEVPLDVSELPGKRPPQLTARLPSFSLFSPFKRSPKVIGLTGVGVTTGGVCVAHIDRTDVSPALEVCDFKAYFSNEELVQILTALVATHGMKGARCTTVMEPGTYSLHLVDAPNVEPSEMRAAIRWRVKELIDFPVDEAVIDVFDVPGRNLRGQGGRMIYVVVARAAEVKRRIELIEGAGMHLDVIDVPELALRNVAALLPEDREGMAMLHMTQHSGLITLTRQETLYLARSFNVGIERLHRLRMQDISANNGETPGLHNALDSIVLEIQRSLDYYERHCSNPPITKLVVAPLDDEIPGFMKHLTSNLGVEVKPLQLDQYLQSFVSLHDSMLRNCLYTIGAALRND
jgi:MSHA biogenesis protein MshI